ncbi:MAG: hypothetical protein NVS3B26_18070 [Mycobacteriales bacterium]
MQDQGRDTDLGQVLPQICSAESLGPRILPALTFSIDTAHVEATNQGPVYTGKIHWVGESNRTSGDLLVSSTETTGARSASPPARTERECRPSRSG